MKLTSYRMATSQLTMWAASVALFLMFQTCWAQQGYVFAKKYIRSLTVRLITFVGKNFRETVQVQKFFTVNRTEFRISVIRRVS